MVVTTISGSLESDQLFLRPWLCAEGGRLGAVSFVPTFQGDTSLRPGRTIVDTRKGHTTTNYEALRVFMLHKLPCFLSPFIESVY